jgi:hypothetical protein
MLSAYGLGETGLGAEPTEPDAHVDLVNPIETWRFKRPPR